MTNNSLITNNGKKIVLNRAYTENNDLSATDYLAPSKYQMGVDNDAITVTSTELTNPIPLADGTVNDNGANTLTGSSGGDNSTDNTTRYKPIPGTATADLKGQNLIKNNTNATAIWTISNLATNGNNVTATERIGNWIYIKDATTLAKIVSIEIKYGSDASNYYSITKLNANLSTGWNWINSQTTNVEDLVETGTVGATISNFIIEIVTNNATDTFVAGDIVYDLLRQWTYTDTIGDFLTTFPSFDYTNLEVEIQTFTNSLKGNGFDIDTIAFYNEDTTPLLHSISQTTEASKSSTDEFTWVIKDRVI